MNIDDKTKGIVEILHRIVATGYITNGYPLSCIIIAPVGAGKTMAVKKIIYNNRLMGFSDFTPYGFAKCLTEIRARNIKHLVIFDLIEPLARNQSIASATLGFLNSLIEDSIFRISTGFIDIKEPIQMGLITTIPKPELSDGRRKLIRMGFLSRLLPISFDFSKGDIIEILYDMTLRGVKDYKQNEIKLQDREIKGNPIIFQRLIPFSQIIDTGKIIGDNKILPFRRMEQLKLLLMANALINGRGEVMETDYEWFTTINRYINFEENYL